MNIELYIRLDDSPVEFMHVFSSILQSLKESVNFTVNFVFGNINMLFSSMASEFLQILLVPINVSVPMATDIVLNRKTLLLRHYDRCAYWRRQVTMFGLRIISRFSFLSFDYTLTFG
uniref:Uncharacterized protein n=1 Tax=Spongospora subterranea TaxID=70186 RepID=A0A0H5RE50_9EUKA|eukprot:CRZ11817.1 hypothetical protein [Spongospora subterranea]